MLLPQIVMRANTTQPADLEYTCLRPRLCSDEIKCVFFLSMQFINTIKYLGITLQYLHIYINHI